MEYSWVMVVKEHSRVQHFLKPQRSEPELWVKSNIDENDPPPLLTVCFLFPVFHNRCWQPLPVDLYINKLSTIIGKSAQCRIVTRRQGQPEPMWCSPLCSFLNLTANLNTIVFVLDIIFCLQKPGCPVKKVNNIIWNGKPEVYFIPADVTRNTCSCGLKQF